MSNSVDQRIVEMQFDNSQFAKGVADTMASLKGLESGLSSIGSTSGLSKVQDMASKINFDEATGSAAGFSGILENLKGTASGVFEHITSGISTVAKGFAIFDALAHTGVAALAIHGGWNRASNINQAEFKLQGLLGDAAKVKEAMANASTAVDGTAYSLDAAAVAAANLSASGVQVGEDLTNSLTLIADLAGVTGRDYASVADIMSAVAAQGKLSGMQVQQFALSGLNVTAALAKELGHTEAEIKDMVSKSEIDFETFSNAMMKAFGGNAKKANETFDGSLANVRAALSRTTADLFQYGQKAMVPVFNGLRESVNALNWALKPLMGTWTDAEGKLQKGVLIKGVEGITQGIGAALHMWGGANKKAETGNFIIDSLTGKASSSWISQGPVRMRRLFQEIADGMQKPLEEISKGSKNFTFALIQMAMGAREILRLVLEFISPIGMALNDVFGDGSFAQFANDFRYKFTEPILEALASFHASEGYVNLMRTAFQFLFTALETGAKTAIPAIGSAFKFVFDLISSVGLGIGAFLDVMAGAGEASEKVGKGLEAAFSPIETLLNNAGLGSVVNFFHNLADGIGKVVACLRGEEGAFENLQEFLNGIKSDTVKNVQNFAKKIEDLGNRIKDFFQSVKDGTDQWVKDNQDKINAVLDFFKNIGEGLGSIFTGIIDGLGLSNLEMPSFLQDFINMFSSFWDMLGKSGKKGEKAAAQFEELRKIAGAHLEGPLNALGGALSTLGDALSNFAKSFKESVPEKVHWFFEQLGKIAERVGPVLESFKDKIKGAWDVITTAFANADFNWEPIKNFFEGIGDALKNLIESIANGDFKITDIFDFFGDIGGSLKNLGDDVGPRLASVFGDIGSAVYDNLEGPLKDLAGWIGDIAGPLDQLGDNFQANMDKLTGLFDGIHFPWEKKEEKPVEGLTKSGGAFGVVAGVDPDQVVDEGFNFLTALENLGKFFAAPVKTISGWISTGMGTLAGAVDQFVSAIDWSKVDDFVGRIASLGLAGGGIAVLYETAQFLDVARGAIGSFKGIIDQLKGIATSIKGVTDAMKQSIKTQAILNIAIAVGILVAALIALSFSDLDKVERALPTILSLLIGVSLIVAAFGKLSTMEAFDMAGISAFSSAMLGLAVAIGIMAIVTAKLGSMPEDQLKQGKSTLIQFALIFAAFTYLMGKLPENVGNIGSTLLKIAVAFGILGIVAGIIGGLPKAAMDRGLGIITGFAVGMAMFTAILGAIDANNVKKSAQGLVEIAGAVVILAAAAFALGHLDEGQLVRGVGAVVVLLVAIGAMVTAFQKFKVYTITKATGSILLLALAVGMLAAAVAGLAVLSSLGLDIMGSVEALVLLMLGITALCAVLQNSKMSLSTSSMGLLALASVIFVLTAAIAALSILDTGSVWMAVLQLAVAIGVFVGALALIGLIAQKLPASTVALKELTIVVIVITAALAALALVAKEGDLVGALISLAVGVGIFVAALALLGVIGEALAPGIAVIGGFFVTLAGAFLTFSVGVALFAVGALIFAGAMKMMADVGPSAADNLVEAIKRLGRGLWEAKGDIALGVAGIGYGIISGLLSLIPIAVVAIAQFIGQMLGAIIALIPAIGYGAVLIAAGFITGLSNGIRDHGGDVLNALKDLVLSMGEGLWNGFLELVDWVHGGMDMIVGAITGQEPEAVAAGRNLGEKTADGVEEGNTMVEDTEAKLLEMNQKYEEGAEGAKEGGKGISEATVEGAEEGADGFDLLKTLNLDPKTFTGNLGDVAELAKDHGIEIPAEFQDALNTGVLDSVPFSEMLDENGNFDMEAVSSKLLKDGDEGGLKYGEGVGYGLQKADITGVLSGTETIDQEAINVQFSEAGTNAANSFGSSFSENIKLDGSGPVEKAAKEMEKPQKFTAAAKKDGSAAAKGLKEGLKDFAKNAKEAGEKAVKEVKSKQQPARSAGLSVGKNVSEGVAVGMRSALGSITRSCNAIIAKIKQTLEWKAKIKSPSKVTAKIGNYIGQGVAVGIQQATPAVAQAAAGTGSVLHSLSTQALEVAELLDEVEGIEDQPVIRPVLDLTDYNAGLAQMRGFDTSSVAATAQFSNSRIFSDSSASSSVGTTNHIQIELNYDAGADANQIVMDIARGLETRLAMEGA